MKIHEVEQGTDEWLELRKGKMTGSNASKIGNAGAGLTTYVKKIVIGMVAEEEDRYYGKDMQRGHELEDVARMKYSFEKNVNVREVGFIEISKYAGYSPDGIVEEDYLDEGKGVIEIKARNNEIHYDLLRTGKVDSATIWQMNFGMYSYNCKWCDFISYNPNFKKNSIFIKRFYRDEEKINAIRLGLRKGTEMIKNGLSQDFIIQELKLK